MAIIPIAGYSQINQSIDFVGELEYSYIDIREKEDRHQMEK